jgi:tRNA-Thr(GGU) m(6)t(6)A37 methyltransferase TsaA
MTPNMGGTPFGNEGDLDSYPLRPIGIVRSPLKDRNDAPNQGSEGAPDARIELAPSVEDGLDRIEPGDRLIIITWLHESRRDVLKTHPRGDESLPLTGVFATCSPDRPNPLGLHPVTVLEVGGRELKVGPLEAIDGTPVVDIKPVLRAAPDR